MKIAIVGLGLIGGSICRALKAADSGIEIYGEDICQKTVSAALASGACDKLLGQGKIDCQVVFVALHPAAAEEFILQNATRFAKGSTVTDVCGVKQRITEVCEPLLQGIGVNFVGGHPMAGREKWGFENSDKDLLRGASYILTRTPQTQPLAFDKVSALVQKMGCRVVETTPQAHDQTIAYTSQLAHIVSNCYIKSPAAARQDGFTGGSFQDLTRVAHLDENLWSELFARNRQNLLKEFDLFMENMQSYRNALEQGDSSQIKALLKQGRELKLALMQKTEK